MANKISIDGFDKRILEQTQAQSGRYWQNEQIIDTDLVTDNDKNQMMVGPIEVDDGIIFEIGDNSKMTILE